MLIRISLFVAIIAGLAVGALNFTKIKSTITDLRTHLQEQTDRAVKAEGERDKTKKELVKTTAALDQTKKDLDATKKERDTAIAAAAALKTQAATLQGNLDKAQKDLTDANIDLAKYKQAFPTAQQALSVAKDMKALQERVDVIEDEKKVLQRQLVRVNNELLTYKDPNRHVTLPATLVGKVLVADPKWDFVVLSVGEDQGAQEHGEMLVNRDGKLVAKIKITSVQKDRCIANVLPGWKLGEVLEGDQVIPAYPAQS
jgi:predicted  nucleic acid-binding Zn-ribbon protein